MFYFLFIYVFLYYFFFLHIETTTKHLQSVVIIRKMLFGVPFLLVSSSD